MEKREKEFERNLELEKFLKEINGDLLCAEQKLLKKAYPKSPVILVMGALRSGTTLMTQWLSNTREFACPTNLISRFFEAPIIGAKIQRLLFDPMLNFRDELVDFSKKNDYFSQNGKTQGPLSPNEFWYFWRRFFPYADLEIDYMPDIELMKVFDKDTFVKEIMGMANVLQKPIVMKGMIANYNIEFLDDILDNVIFLYIKREPCSNIVSALEAKRRQLGDDKVWFSFRIPEMKELLKIREPSIQMAGQIYYINQAIERSLEKVSQERKLEIQYEEFCEKPEKFYHIFRGKLKLQGFSISEKYCGEEKFNFVKRGFDPEIYKFYKSFECKKRSEKEWIY